MSPVQKLPKLDENFILVSKNKDLEFLGNLYIISIGKHWSKSEVKSKSGVKGKNKKHVVKAATLKKSTSEINFAHLNMHPV